MNNSSLQSPAPEGFWGPITSSIDWCESNYTVTPLLAEFWNTVTNSALILGGLWGARQSALHRHGWQFVVLSLLVVVIGVGSVLFHMSLTFEGQQADETPMVWSMLCLLYVQYSEYLPGSVQGGGGKMALARGRKGVFSSRGRAAFATLLLLYGVAFAVLHYRYRWVTTFQVHFVVLMLLNTLKTSLIYMGRDRWPGMEPARKVQRWAWAAALAAGGFWLVDYHFCEQMQRGPNPQLHAVWHVLMGYYSYIAVVFPQFYSGLKRGLNPQLRFTLPFLPYVKLGGGREGKGHEAKGEEVTKQKQANKLKAP